MMLIISFAIIVLSVIFDQVTKIIAVTDLKPIGAHPFIEGLIELRYTTNTGVAFGMLEGQRWIFVPLSFIAIALVIYLLIRYRKVMSPLLSVAVSMIAGGGIGNQIDRIVRGEVVDFLNFEFFDFPIFNVADCFVTVGCVLAAIAVIFFDEWIFDDGKPSKKAPKASETPKDDK